MSFDVRKSTWLQSMQQRGTLVTAGKYRKPLLVVGALVLLLALSVGIAAMAPATSHIPTFAIVDVDEDQSVTIRTANFPANQNFVVTMGPMGTRGINGIVVTTTNSGAGGSFDVTYDIPAALHGSYQIAIRLQSPQGYYAYNWFYNNTTGGVVTPGPGTGVIPRFFIESVVKDQTVTIETQDIPENRDWVVTMGPMGTRGINGHYVTTINSGAGGTFTETFSIPAALHGSYQISIRLQATTGGYYAYNWFYNNTYPGTGSGNGTGGGDVYYGIPTFSIQSVEEDQTATIETNNFPENRDWVVTMGPMGTKGINGIQVTTLSGAPGGTFTETFDIPAALHGSYQIAIRLQATTGGYYAFNWFYNSSADTTDPSPDPDPDDGYSGYPWFNVDSVVSDQTVTVDAFNLPADQEFIVTMGPMGTKGVNGIAVATTDSGSGGDLADITYQIPEALHGSNRIAIRMQSADGYYAYNWFWNSTTN